jgi:hypothetical protein
LRCGERCRYVHRVTTRFDTLVNASLAMVLLLIAGCGSRDGANGAGSDATSGKERVTVQEAVPDTGSDPMIVSLVDAFTARNPAARHITIVEFRREGSGGGANLVLARGAKPDAAFEGRTEDELFGVFVFDDSLRRIRQTVAMFPSPRGGGTSLRFDRTTAESVFVLGWASTSGETLMTAGFPWGTGAGR